MARIIFKNISQLPELRDEFIVFILKEKKIKGQDYIIITHKTKTIWKEILTYEYYKRFIELGKCRAKYRQYLVRAYLLFFLDKKK